MEEAWIPGLGHVVARRVPGLLLGDAAAAARRPDSRGWTALHSAAHENGDNLGRHLADIESRTLAGNTPLHLAVRAGHICWLPTLITPTTLDSQNNQGFTPLQLALIHRQWKAAAVLVAAGACLYSPDTPPSSPSLASLPEEEPGLPLMLLKGMLADRSSAGLVAQAMRWKDARGNTALHAAARAGRLEEVRRLLRAGADLHVANAAGATPLAVAQQHGHVHLVPLLDPATSSLEMYGTPIHVAAMKGDAAAVLAQLAAGAQPDSYAPGGSSILAVAAQHGHTRVVAVLLAALVKKYGPENQQQQPQQQHKGQGQQQQQQPLGNQQQQRHPNAPCMASDRLVTLVAAAIVPLARELEDSSSCAQLLGVVLDVLGLEVTQQACGVVKTQLKREWKQQERPYSLLAAHGGCLVEALLLGCLGAESRRLVPTRLQRLVPGVGAVAADQQQQEQTNGASRQQGEWVGERLQRLVTNAVAAGSRGHQQEALSLLTQFAELYLQQPRSGLTSSAKGARDGCHCKPSSAHQAGDQLQPPPQPRVLAVSSWYDAEAQATQGSPSVLAKLVRQGLVQAGHEHTGGWAMYLGGPTPEEHLAEFCRSQKLQDALLSAWVAARKQPCDGLVAAAVAAVTASRQVQRAVAEPLQQQQQQEGVEAAAGDTAQQDSGGQQQQEEQQGGGGTLRVGTDGGAPRSQPRAARRQRKAQPPTPLACTLRSRSKRGPV